MDLRKPDNRNDGMWLRNWKTTPRMTWVDSSQNSSQEFLYCWDILVVLKFVSWSMHLRYCIPLELEFDIVRAWISLKFIAQDSDYCLWVVETYKENPEKCRRELKEMAQWLLQNEPDLFNNSERKLGFGKHSDQTWDWVIENDKDTQVKVNFWCFSFF